MWNKIVDYGLDVVLGLVFGLLTYVALFQFIGEFGILIATYAFIGVFARLRRPPMGLKCPPRL